MSFKDLRAARAGRHHPSFDPRQHQRSSPSGEGQTGPAELSDLAGTAGIQKVEEARGVLPEQNETEMEVQATGSASGTSRRGLSAEETNELLRLGEHGLEVRDVHGRGRGLFGRKTYRPGDRILSLSSRQTCSALSSKSLPSNCSGCYLSSLDSAALDHREPASLLRCAGCKVVHYCSKDCQRSDWPLHVGECKALQRLRNSESGTSAGAAVGASGAEFPPPEWVRAMGRLVWARKAQQAKGGELQAWDEYMTMQSHPTRSEDKAAEIRRLAKKLEMYLGDSFVSGEELETLVSKFQTNSFTLSSPDLTPLGALVSPHAAMANHSCVPNAVVVFPLGAGRGVDIVAIGEIGPGEEILTSYIDVSSPWETRQHELESQYAFTCSCPLCLSTAPRDDPSSAPAASSSTPTASTAPTASAARDSPVTAAALASTTKPQADPRWCLLHQTCSQGEGGLIPMPKILTPHSTPILARAVESGLGFDGRKQGKCEGCGEVVPVDVTALPGWIEKAKMMIRLDEEGSLWDRFGTREKPSNAITSLQTVLAHLLSQMPPSSYPVLPLLRLLFLLNLPPATPSDLDPTLSALSISYEASTRVYPPNHPSLAIILAEWGKFLFALATEDWIPATLQDRLHRVMQAQERLVIAVKACESGFGRAAGGGLVGMEMRGLVERCEVEKAGISGEMELLRRKR
ncbi:hypothetical protein EHS25_009835 [Saitozyma podzolica]|uniref:SET domain-containing protein n=1 Tax=Saitozyma podzolica TaxID=1890683 RepID=A0A427YKE1_9TREE|nr:hypothetical protein EHS25_009835 [Saitozyma podzolica]